MIQEPAVSQLTASNDQNINLKAIESLLRQLVDLYEFMNVKMGLKNLQITPESILIVNGKIKVYSLCLSSSLSTS